MTKGLRNRPTMIAILNMMRRTEAGQGPITLPAPLSIQHAALWLVLATRDD